MIKADGKLLNIQVLRGIAALAVAILHISGTQLEGGILFGQGIAAYGWMGVDLFFVISGFIMVWVTQDITPGTKTATRFLLIRFARIYPLWWVCVFILGLLYMVIHGVPAPLGLVEKSEAWPHFLKSLFLIPHELGPIVGPGWSLIHELYFYIIFTLIIMFNLRKSLWAALTVWFSCVVFGGFLNLDHMGPALKIIFNIYTLYFIVGAATALIILKHKSIPSYGLHILSVGAVSVVALVMFGFVSVQSRVWQLILPLTFIVYGAVIFEMKAKFKTPRFLVWLGDISYSLYLTHWLVLLAWQITKPIYPNGMLYSIVEGWPRTALVAFDFTILMVGCLVVAHIFYTLIEKPSLQFFRRHITSYGYNVSKSQNS